MAKDDGNGRAAIVLLTSFVGLLFLFDIWLGMAPGMGRILAALGVAVATVAAIVFAVPAWRGLQQLWGEPEAVSRSRWTGLAVLTLAGCGLYFELALIRWHASLFPMFSFYKNFSLLACFAGLGLGYATTGRGTLPLLQSVVLLAVQVVALILVRYGTGDALGFLMTSPVAEQTTMGTTVMGDHEGALVTVVTSLVVYGLLASVFLTTIAIFIPLGRLTGQLMETMPRLPAYGWNLAGSIAGVVAFMLTSELWLPPVAWFAAVIALLLGFSVLDGGRRIIAAAMVAIIMSALAWPVEPTRQRIFSPYQLIEITAQEDTGLMRLLAAGTYFQKVYDFSVNGAARYDPELAEELAYYNLPYLVASALDRVAVVGAGTGNDVAAALRAGAKAVDAVEIDPVIVELGRAYHPERPYHDPRVDVVVEDARTFFRTTHRTYDAITYAVLDSHTQMSHGTSVRLDSFVYTREAFAESYARLRPGGVLYVSFTLLAESQGPRIYEMLREAADRSPVAINVGYDRDSTTAFVVFKGEPSAGWEERVTRSGFELTTEEHTTFETGLDIPTDDWPFFYMPRRTYPVSYLPAISLMLAITLFAGGGVLWGQASLRTSVGFALLGAGFMLIQAKAITQLGLAFGNTWMVVAIVIVAILLMAFIANVLVDLARLRRSRFYHISLIVAVACAWLVYGTPLVDDYNLDRLLTVIVLTAPIAVSGVVFSTELRGSGIDVSRALGFNILGAMVGGMLEYNSMYFGFSFLFVLAAVIYAGALVAFWPRRA